MVVLGLIVDVTLTEDITSMEYTTSTEDGTIMADGTIMDVYGCNVVLSLNLLVRPTNSNVVLLDLVLPAVVVLGPIVAVTSTDTITDMVGCNVVLYGDMLPVMLMTNSMILWPVPDVYLVISPTIWMTKLNTVVPPSITTAYGVTVAVLITVGTETAATTMTMIGIPIKVIPMMKRPGMISKLPDVLLRLNLSQLRKRRRCFVRNWSVVGWIMMICVLVEASITIIVSAVISMEVALGMVATSIISITVSNRSMKPVKRMMLRKWRITRKSGLKPLT
jgi:hypothetical protein